MNYDLKTLINLIEGYGAICVSTNEFGVKVNVPNMLKRLGKDVHKFGSLYGYVIECNVGYIAIDVSKVSNPNSEFYSVYIRFIDVNKAQSYINKARGRQGLRGFKLGSDGKYNMHYTNMYDLKANLVKLLNLIC